MQMFPIKVDAMHQPTRSASYLENFDHGCVEDQQGLSNVCVSQSLSINSYLSVYVSL